MRNVSAVIWLLIGIGVSLVVSRVGRPLGVVGGILAIVLVMVVIGVAWEVVRTRARARGLYQPVAQTKNVTPREPALPAGRLRTPEDSAAGSRTPSVIVVEPPDGTDLLGARLQALDRLRADGLVTDGEYEAKRAQLISDF